VLICFSNSDVKPENILLNEDGHVLLADFGLSQGDMGEGEVTFSLSGTSEYLAPEMLLNDGHGQAVDWWMLGVVLHEMLTGTHPFYSKNTYRMHQNVLHQKPQLSKTLSEEARSLLNGFFQKKPSERLGTNHKGRDIENHPFFLKYKIDWGKMERKEYEPEIKPNVKVMPSSVNPCLSK
jgi:serine/threonine protein kinase